MLTFEEATHIYTWDGQVVPSVTQVIGEWIKLKSIYVNVFNGSVVQADVFEAGGMFGTDVHTMIHLYLQNDLNREALSPELEGVLVQFETLLNDRKVEILNFEKGLYSKKYGYAGTLDLSCFIGNRLSIIDYKSGGYAMAGPQEAAYVQLLREELKYRKLIDRYVLRLPKGKSYKFIKMENPHDWDFFKYRLFQYQYLRRK